MPAKKSFDFEALGEALRVDAQQFLDSYTTAHPEDGPIQAFCLYFDSQSGPLPLVLPQRAITPAVDASVDDVASWYRYGDQVEGGYSEHTEALLSAYEEYYYEDRPDKQQDKVVAQFHQMVSWIVRHLSFEKLNKAADFIFFAEAMDEEYDDMPSTIPPALLKKFFGL